MTGPSLQKTAALSFALHITVLLISFVVLRQTHHMITLPTYTVSLVSPDLLPRGDRGGKTTLRESKVAAAPAARPDLTQKVIAKGKAKTKAKTKDNKWVESKIATLAAKKRIEKIVNLRSVISLKGKQGTSEAKGTGTGDYYSKITQEIWSQWAYPDTGQKNLEAIISIRVFMDGTVVVQRIEKSSGNAFFDKSAMKAIAKASPLSPPPHEMEIGVRFFP
jgi:TolA protein